MVVDRSPARGGDRTISLKIRKLEIKILKDYNKIIKFDIALLGIYEIILDML